MIARAEVPLEWFGQLKPEVGQTIQVVLDGRISKIEEDLVDVRGFDGGYQPPLGGETYVTVTLTQMRMPLSEVERLR